MRINPDAVNDSFGPQICEKLVLQLRVKNLMGTDLTSHTSTSGPDLRFLQYLQLYMHRLLSCRFIDSVARPPFWSPHLFSLDFSCLSLPLVLATCQNSLVKSAVTFSFYLGFPCIHLWLHYQSTNRTDGRPRFNDLSPKIK